MPQSLVIVPTYNERENLPLVIERVVRQSPPVDLLVVDDNSPDGTGQIAHKLAGQHSTVYVLHRHEKYGLGRAYCAGFSWALERDYEFICEMDGDLSHNPDDLPRLLEAARDADLVLGSRYLYGVRVVDWPLRRRLLSRGAARYVRFLTGMPVTDPTGGFKCFRRSALEAIDLRSVRSDGYAFQIELTHRLWRAGGRLVEIPITFTERSRGRSKMSGAIVREAVFVVWNLACREGTRFLERRDSNPAVGRGGRQADVARLPVSIDGVARENH